MFKQFVQRRLENAVKKYFEKHSPKLIVVVGGAGKTTTKVAIATILSAKYRIQLEENNHNTQMSVPLAILGIKYPENVHSVMEWLKVLKAARIRIKSPTGVDVIVQELGTDHPGEIPHFGTYLKPDIAVVTSVVPEHMEFFEDMDAVAKEELSVAGYSKLTVVNRDDVDENYAKYADTSNISTYGLEPGSEYTFDIADGSPFDSFIGSIVAPEFGEDRTQTTVHLVGEHSLKAAIVAGAIAAKLGMTSAEVASGLSKLQPVNGRMKVLSGFRSTTLIDDTYNASPKAMAAAIRTLYQVEAVQRIAVLGSMNELGASSSQAHQEIGRMCDPSKLDWVVTIGQDATNYLAPAARAQGCQVESFMNPFDAGAFVNKVMNEGAIVLFKGSQDGVYAEEAVKMLLAHIEDEKYLVRQSPDWIEKKNARFEAKYYSDIANSKD